MASSNRRGYSNANQLISDLMDISTGSALAGMGYVLAAGVMFLGVTASISVPVSYTFEANIAIWLGVATLALAFASSETRDPSHYHNWEKGLVAANLVMWLGTEYSNDITVINDMVMSNEYTRSAAFIIAVGAWLIVSR